MNRPSSLLDPSYIDVKNLITDDEYEKDLPEHTVQSIEVLSVIRHTEPLLWDDQTIPQIHLIKVLCA